MTVLYRKYRPQNFDEVIGQSGVVNFLKESISKDKLPHAIILSGPRGTGKTTLARIVALTVNCEKIDDQVLKPCLECTSCKHILESEFSDLIEIDAASNRRIDDIRNLKEMVGLPPHFGKKKVYLIDEAHMITHEAFNAFLKTLEEPPEHVVFIFATTEVEKFPDTILSRCQELKLQTIPVKELEDHLKDISKKENITIEDIAISLIAEYSEGCARDAISLLEQVSRLDDITEGKICRFLNIISEKEINELIDITLNVKEKELHEYFTRLDSLGLSAKSLVKQFIKSAENRISQSTISDQNGKYLLTLLKNLLETGENLSNSISPITSLKVAFLDTMISIVQSTKTPVSNHNTQATPPKIVERTATLNNIANSHTPSTKPLRSDKLESIKDPVIKGLLMGQEFEILESKVEITANSNFIFEKLNGKKADLEKEFQKPVSINMAGTPKSQEPEVKPIQTTDQSPKSEIEKDLVDIFQN